MQRLLVSLVMLAVLGGCATQNRYPPPQRYPADTGRSGQSEPPPSRWPDQSPSSPSDGGYGDVIGSPSEPEPMPEPSGPPPPRTVAEASGPAVVALLGKADAKASSGQSDQAAAYVERAVAVEPRNPFIFQRLAAIRLDQGEADQAEAMARKSNSLAGDNPYVKAGNWKIIAEARRMRGDAAGGSEADSRSRDYLSQTRNR